VLPPAQCQYFFNFNLNIFWDHTRICIFRGPSHIACGTDRPTSNVISRNLKLGDIANVRGCKHAQH